MATCTQKVLIAAAEIGLEIDLVPVNVFAGDQKKPEHLARQPFGKIPALEDGDFRMYEARAIARYLADKYGRAKTDAEGGSPLIPATAEGRALMEQWMSLEYGVFTPEIVDVILFQRVFSKFRGIESKPELAEASAEKLQTAFNVMEANLASRQFLAGDKFSLADLAFAPYFHLLMKTPEATLITSRKNVDAWWKRVASYPAVVKGLAVSML